MLMRKIVGDEVRDSRTGYLVPGRDGPGVWPDGRVVGASSSPSASFGKLGNWKFQIISFFRKLETPDAADRSVSSRQYV